LAECQKSTEVKQRFQAATPSARQLQLAERVEFPERNEEFASIRTHLAEGVRMTIISSHSRNGFIKLDSLIPSSS